MDEIHPLCWSPAHFPLNGFCISFSLAAVATDSTSQEKMAYELTVEAMDLMFWEKFNDPYYNVTADDWYPMIIDDQDDELDWTDYKMNLDYYDPLQKKVRVTGSVEVCWIRDLEQDAEWEDGVWVSGFSDQAGG